MLDDLSRTKLSDRFNIVGITDCGKFLVDKNSNLTATILINSSVADGLDEDRYNQFFNIRKQVFEKIAENYYFSVHSTRKRILHNEEKNITNKTIKKIGQIWNSQFTTSYSTEHYLAITTRNKTLLARTIDSQQQVDLNKLEELDNLINEILSALHQYNPKLLTSNTLANYWISLLNKNENNTTIENGLIDDVSNTNILFGNKDNYFTYDDGSDKKYSCFLSIKAYPAELTKTLFKELQKFNAEFTIFQHYEPEDIFKSRKKIDERISRASKTLYINETSLTYLKALKDALDNDEFKLFIQNFNIQVIADSLDELNKKAIEIKTLVEGRKILMVRETINTEACFWSIFPTWEHMRIRKYQITSENLAHFITFASDNNGIANNTWGNGSVAKFFTDNNSIYDFSFHESSADRSPGNTIVIGGTNSGKTTLISFLLGQCMHYDDFKCMAFDRRFGLKVFANIIGANYSDFNIGGFQNINPLQMDEKHKHFLQNWLKGLLDRNNDEDVEIISEAINQNFTLPKINRNLTNLAPAFGRAGKGSIRNAFNLWLPDGANGNYFNGKKDSLDFDKDFTFFDTTSILDNESILGAVADYLFYRLQTVITKDPKPYAIFVDELNKYLVSKQFAPKLLESAAEIRKTNGILIMAVQSAMTIFKNQTFQEMKTNISTYILFPDSQADSQYYIDEIGLTAEEFKWIKTSGGRQVMIKKKNAETVVLNIDLSSLGNYLKVFDSATETVKKVETLKKRHPKDWMDKYLNIKGG
jgi:type IV secretion/conjugal transfer VirB4 family ATPase